MKLRWYADNSEVVGWRGAQIQDVFLFGGVIVPESDEREIRNRIEAVKSKYGSRRAPVKWNFKDLKSRYEQKGLKDLYTTLLNSSQEWRSEILHIAMASNAKIVTACIESYSLERKIIKLRKQSIAQYAFANSLQRTALHAKQAGATSCDVVLDWPDKADPHPFCSEYASAFNEGKTIEGHPYHSGALSALGFSDTPMFQHMENSCLLQLSDLVVGAVREYVEYSLGKREGGLGVDLTRDMKHLFYGAPRNICGWGLVLAGAGEFRQKIKDRVTGELL